MAKPAFSQDRQPHDQEELPKSASARFFRSGAFFFAAKMDSPGWNFSGGPALSVRIEGTEVMLVERGLRVMNVEAVGDAYAIASNYLRQTGGIADTFVTNERLLEMIVGMFQRGEMNKIRLANKAISRFEAAALV
jgi:hypothetical protein